MAQMQRSERAKTKSQTRETKSNYSKHSNKSKERKPSSKSNYEDANSKGYPEAPNSNDFAWHAPANDVALLERASELPWSFQTGERVGLAQAVVGMGPGTTRKMTGTESGRQPGIMVIREQITCGQYGQETPGFLDPAMNLPSYNASIQLLSEMRSRARIRNTYDAPDVFMLIMAMANIYMAVILGRRLAATTRSFTYQNEYLPRVLIQAQGFDPDWFFKNQFTFVTELNVLISEINKVYVPNRMALFRLINERFSGYFTEGTSIRDQIYLFTPAFLNMIELNPDVNYASWLRPIMVLPGKITGTDPSQWRAQYDASNLYTGNELLMVIRGLLNAVLTLQSTADITGDMMNCFGEGERFILPEVNPAEVAVPIFNEEILETIHNAWSAPCVTYEFQTYDNQNGNPLPFTCLQRVLDNRIGYYDLFKIDLNTWAQYCLEIQGGYTLIDVHKDPDSHKTFAITRLRNPIQWITDNNDNTASCQVKFASDLVCAIETYMLDASSGVPYMNPFYSVVQRGYTPYTYLFNSEPFHYRPNSVLVNGTNDGLLIRWVTGETDIYAQVRNSDLDVMNRISLLSLLGAYNNLK